LDPDWLAALFWAIPAIVLAGMCLVLALALSPLLVPYLVIRRFRGRDAANRFAEVVVTLVVVLICAYQVAIWVDDPASFYRPLK
jgi:hypothetical protein